MTGARDPHVIAYDIGTTSAKVCLFRLGERLELASSALQSYPLRVVGGGGVEQDPDAWWRAMALGTRDVLAYAGLSAEAVAALSFSSQMQGLVLVDDAGTPVRPAMSYLDSRAAEQYQRVARGGVRVGGFRARLLVPSLVQTGGLSASVKDPVWKYLWVREHEPEVFARVRHWLDVKDYLAMRCTGRAAMTEDSANVTFLFDTRPGKLRWSDGLCRLHGVERRHLPDVIRATDTVGALTPRAALELGLSPGVRVVGGGGDLTMVALGTGCVAPGDTHVYIGTSGWVSSVVDRRVVDLDHFMASILGARAGAYNYIGEQETSGKCLEWARDQLARDGIGAVDGAAAGASDGDVLLDAMVRAAAAVPAGAGGVLFAPWLHGNRSPFEDALARGVFFNLGLDTTKAAMLRAVLEGIVYQKRWMLECMAATSPIRGHLRFAGGGAASDLTCRILADVTGRVVEAVENPRSAGALGAAAVCALALGAVTGFDDLRASIPLRGTYTPDPAAKVAYDRNYEVFRQLHPAVRRQFAALNGAR